jgi:hypothetical protein
MPSPWASELWGLSPTPGTPLPGCDANNCVSDLWFRAGFMSPEDMAVDDRWTTLDDLYEYADEAVKRLTYALGMFKAYDASVAVAAGTAQYTLPAEHAFTVIAWLAYAAGPVQMLRLSNVAQLFALDAAWSVATGPPVRLSLDAGGTGTATLYPAPVTNATLAQVEQYLPHTVAAGASDIPLSPICQDYVSYAMLATALSKESDHAKPEVAAHCAERCRLLEQVFQHLWGEGE